jgi:para-nitrobenzyl esterase
MPSGAYYASALSYLFEYAPPLHELSAAQEELSTQMMRYWAALARLGAPHVRGEPRWRPFTPENPRVLSLEKEGSHEILDFAADHHCDFWLE